MRLRSGSMTCSSRRPSLGLLSGDDMGLIGTKPAPRILVWGIGVESDLARFIMTIAPTVKFLENLDDIATTRQLEWGAIIILGESPPKAEIFESHLMAIQFGGVERILRYQVSNFDTRIEIRATGHSFATEFAIPDSLPPALRRLVESSLLPYVQSRDQKLVL